MKNPMTKLEWCKDCGERYTKRRRKTKERSLMTGRTSSVFTYDSDPHPCPQTCSFCHEAYTIERRGYTFTDPHSCPGLVEAEQRERERMKAMLTQFNDFMQGVLERPRRRVVRETDARDFGRPY